MFSHKFKKLLHLISYLILHCNRRYDCTWVAKSSIFHLDPIYNCLSGLISCPSYAYFYLTTVTFTNTLKMLLILELQFLILIPSSSHLHLASYLLKLAISTNDLVAESNTVFFLVFNFTLILKYTLSVAYKASIIRLFLSDRIQAHNPLPLSHIHSKLPDLFSIPS